MEDENYLFKLDYEEFYKYDSEFSDCYETDDYGNCALDEILLFYKKYEKDHKIVEDENGIPYSFQYTSKYLVVRNSDGFIFLIKLKYFIDFDKSKILRCFIKEIDYKNEYLEPPSYIKREFKKFIKLVKEEHASYMRSRNTKSARNT
jgi:hypothetical protein